MSEPLTAGEALRLSGFSEYRKTALTSISDRTFPPGTTYQTPEGLRAEDEETRCAFDVQGGIYPIRESVFQASYALAAVPAHTPGALDEPPRQAEVDAIIEAARSDNPARILTAIGQYATAVRADERRRVMEAYGRLDADIQVARTEAASPSEETK